MKVYSPPAGIEAPSYGHYDLAKDDELTTRYLNELRAWLKSHGYNHRKTGLIVHFPVADGSAQYMIMNADKLMYLPLGDAWQITDAHARGLRISELEGSTS
jgi:hypothetical protein